MSRRRDFLDLFQVAGAGDIGIEIVDRLDQMGFFTAPASTKYHGAYDGGLFDHSMAVTEQLLKLTEDNGLVWTKKRSPVIVGMFHDLCKVDRYEKEADGYRYKEKSAWGPGHGSVSAMIAGTLCKLTEEEAMCIRYHMGAYEKDEWSSYDAAIRICPNVLWTHHADMLASKVTGI